MGEVSIEKHSAEGDVDALSCDIATLFLGLYVLKTQQRAALRDKETFDSIARALKEHGLVARTADNRCEMVRPRVESHLEFICYAATLSLSPHATAPHSRHTCQRSSKEEQSNGERKEKKKKQRKEKKKGAQNSAIHENICAQ